MKLNRELRTKKMNIRFHALWVLFYLILFSVLIYISVRAYNKHNDNSFPSGHIVLSVGKKKYQLEEKITFKIENNFPSTIYVTNNCPSEPLHVYKWVGKKWVQIHDTAKDKNSNCYKQPRQIAIGARSSIQYDFEDWPNLFKNPGVYRLVVKLEHYKDMSFVDFVILKPAKVIDSPDGDSTLPSDSAPTPDPIDTITTTEEEPEDQEEEREDEAEDEPGED